MIYFKGAYNLHSMLRQKIKRKILRLIAAYGYKVVDVNPNSTKFLYEDKPDQEILYLNVGAGAWFHPYWENFDNPRADYSKSLNSSLDFDLTSGDSWPIKDNSLKYKMANTNSIDMLNGFYICLINRQFVKFTIL